MSAYLAIASTLTLLHPAPENTIDTIAAITVPVRGQRADGIVYILGSANHPAFDHYELHFSLDPNPTDTWFPIVLAGAKPLDNSQLGQWDTDSISTGTYMLRLQVFAYDGSLPNEVIIPGISVGADPEPPTPTLAPTIAATIKPQPVATRVLVIDSQTSNNTLPFRNLFSQLREKHDYSSTFVNSAAYSVAAFLTLGVYLQLRKLIRPHVRRLLRRVRSDLRRP